MEENCSAASKGKPSKSYPTVEDVINLMKMEEEAAARSRLNSRLLEYQQRKLNNGAGADKSNGEIIQSTPSKKPRLENNLNIDTMAAAAAERLLSFCKKAHVASSPGKLSIGDECGHQRKHNESKRQMYSPAGQSRKEKYVRLRIRQQARVSRRRRSVMAQSTQETISNTELLRMFMLAGSLYSNQQHTSWSDHELDCLWVGVHRHGMGKWLTVLRDPGLRFSSKTANNLAERWNLEELNSTIPCFKARLK